MSAQSGSRGPAADVPRSTTEATSASERWRVAPSVPVAIAVFVAYVIVFIGLSSTSGVAYDEWFASGGNAFRSAVIPLIGGSIVLIGFLAWARWDGVFRDPVRLPMHGLSWIPLIFVIGFVAHFLFVDWAQVPADLLVAILAAGVLVGFAEEVLFRGIILRCLRTDLRPEAWVMVISSAWFGVFHATNLANGSPLAKAGSQVLLAAGSGVILYLCRRWRGLLVVGMIAHGLWDMSVFLPPSAPTGQAVGFASLVVVQACAIIALVVIIRKDRRMAVTQTGLDTLPAAAQGVPAQ